MQIYTPIKSDIVLRNLTPFKKFLKPIKVKNDFKFIDEIFERKDALGSLLHRNISLDQIDSHEELSINCTIKFDLGFEIWCYLGSGYTYGISFYDDDDCENQIYSLEEFKKEMEGKRINQFIKPVSMVLNQKVNNVESSFTYKVH